MVGRSVKLLGVAWLCGFVVWVTWHKWEDGVCEIVVSGLGRGFPVRVVVCSRAGHIGGCICAR